MKHFKFYIFRYSRAAKNQLRVYEKDYSGDLNALACVKEYSRSSADQDVPLPHEMRPDAVLDTAMNHIMCNVIDRVDSIGKTFTKKPIFGVPDKGTIKEIF